MYDWNGGWGPGGRIAMGLMMLVFWGLVAAVVVYAIRATSRGREGAESPPRHDDAALRILDERFARGDIDAEEYTQRRDLLRTR